MFSFLEHDFKECLIPQKGLTSEEETYLTVTNISKHPVTVRPLQWTDGQSTTVGHRVFKVEYDTALNANIGNQGLSTQKSVLPLPPSAPSSSGVVAANRSVPQLVRLLPNFSAQFRIVFSPQDSERHYSGSLAFLVDETACVPVRSLN